MLVKKWVSISLLSPYKGKKGGEKGGCDIISVTNLASARTIGLTYLIHGEEVFGG